MEGSNKLKIDFVKRMFEADLTSKEFDFLMYLALRQDNKGVVRGVYYKAACEKIKMSYPEFYEVMRSLKEKGLISLEKNNRIDWDITLVDNRFDYDDAFSEGYLKVTCMFENKSFLDMKAGAKLLALDLLRLSAASRASVKIKKRTLCEKYCKLLKVQNRMLWEYMKQIRRFFAIYLKDGLFYITPFKASRERAGIGSETDNCHEHFIKAICRRNQVKEDRENKRNLKSVRELINQYKQLCFERGERIERIIEYSVEASINMINRNIKKKKDWLRELRPKLIHRLIRQTLKIDNMLEF